MGTNAPDQNDGRSMLHTTLDGAKTGISGLGAYGVGGLGPLGALTGPLSAFFAMPTLMSGIEEHDPMKIVKGGIGVGSGGYSTVKGLGSIMDFMLGGGEAAASTAGLGAAGTGFLGTGASFLGSLGPLAAAAGLGWDVGRHGDRAANNYVKEHDFHDGMTSDEYRFAEGQKVDSGGFAGHVAGANRAVEVAFEDDALAFGNATGITMPAGSADAIVRTRNEARDRHAASAVLASTPAHEEPSMGRTTQTSHELSTADQIKVWKMEREMKRTTQDIIDMANGEIQMPNMDMRRPAAKHR